MIVVNLIAWNCNDTPLHKLTCYFLAQTQREFVLGLAAQKSHTSSRVHTRRLWKWQQVYSVFPMRWQSFRQKQHFIVWWHKERAASPSPTLSRNNRAALKEAWGIGRRKKLGLMWALRFIHMCSRDSSFVITLANERMRAETRTVEISRASESRLITTKTLVNIEKGQTVLQEGQRIWSASLTGAECCSLRISELKHFWITAADHHGKVQLTARGGLNVCMCVGQGDILSI